MRCPKCGYNSFDHLDSCKKCGKDLLEHKQRFGFVSVLFPGQMKPVGSAAVAEDVSATVDAAVAAATAPAASAEVAESAADVAAPTAASEGDDFGFDFMGDSEEEEDLSFDELFEEAPADEDVEETLPAPEEEAVGAEDAADEFAFDMSDDGTDEDTGSGTSDLEDDFGFDPAVESSEPAEPEEASAEEDDFSFETDNVEFAETDEDVAGTEGDPKDPFDLPESSQLEEAPEQDINYFAAEPEPALDSLIVEEDDLLLSEAEDLVSAVVVPSPPVTVVDESLFETVDVSIAPVDSVGPPCEPSVDPLVDELEGPQSVVEEMSVERAGEAVEVPPVIIAGEGPAGPFSALVDEPSSGPEKSLDELPGDPHAVVAAELDVVDEPVSHFDESQPEADPQPLVTPEPDPAVALVAASTFNVPEVSNPLQSEGPAGEESVKESLAEELFVEPAEQLLPATGSRIAAFCCDLLLLLIVGTSFVIAAEAAISAPTDGLLPSFETLIDLSVPYFLVLFSLAFGYFTLFHFLAGQTPGKMLAGLRVETVAGDPLLFSQAFLRSVGGLLQLLPVGLGYLVILSSSDRRGWNDRLAGTRLITLKGLLEEA